MKKLILILMIFAVRANSQTVETVDFNQPSDLAQNFTPITQSGIDMGYSAQWGIGGTPCLYAPSNSISGENDAVYRSKYKNQVGQIYKTSINFLYSKDNMPLNSLNNGLVISLIPKGDYNSNVSLLFGANNGLAVKSSSSYANGGLGLMQTNNWYKVELVVDILNTDSALITANAYNSYTNDLVCTISIKMGDQIFIKDSSVSISIFGQNDGGVMYLDNFMYNGLKSVGSMSTSNIEQNKFKLYPNPTNGKNFAIQLPQNLINPELYIMDLNGKELQKIDVNDVNISNLSSGIYFICLRSDNANTIVQKILVSK